MPEILSGTAGSVSVNGTIVGEVDEWSLDIEQTPVTTTAFGVEWEAVIDSLRAASGTFSANTDTDDAAQTALTAALHNGQSVTLRLWLDAISRFELSAYLTDESDGVTVDGADTTVYDYVMSGNLTYSTLRYALLEDGDNILCEDGDDLLWEGA